MRNINATALSEISKQFGLESILIVRIWWNDIPYDYSDKENLDEAVFGKVLAISGLDNVLALDGASTSSSATVTLDDSGGQLREIINTGDIHKKKVQILQWFSGRPKSDAFVLFTGQINTPMVWTEGERTLTISIVNMVENREVGFSFEEGIIQGIPVDAYGKAFPIVFGQAYKVPAVQLSEQPAGILAQGFAWIYEDVYQAEIDELLATAADMMQQSRLLQLAGTGASLVAAGYNDGSDVFTPPDDYSQYQSYFQAAQQYFAQAEQVAQESLAISQRADAVFEDLEQKRAYAIRQIIIASSNFPRGYPVTVEIDGTRFTVRFDGVVMNVIDEVELSNLRPGDNYIATFYDQEVSRVYESRANDTKFKWFDAGTEIRVVSVPMFFVACQGLIPAITGVYARKNGVRVRVPNNLYQVLRIPFTNAEGSTYLTVLQLAQPLTTIVDIAGQPLYDSDEIWCDIIGEVPAEFATIVNWAVSTFTDLMIDPGSFTEVGIQTQFAPMNFVLLDRKNVFDFIKELAYQARCAVWVSDQTVYLRYLAAEPTPVDTITQDDVVEGSLSITSTTTEEITTKLIASWNLSHDQEEPNRVIVRQNVERYGLSTEEIDFYAYNNFELVQRSAIFWLIRKAIMWKKISMKVFINKLKLESHDPVLLSGFGGLFSRNDVVGIVETANFDSSTNQIDMVIWLPIRWGEIDPYTFAYPANVVDLWGRPGLDDYRTGNPFYEAQDVTGFLTTVGNGFISRGPRPPVDTVGENGLDISDRPSGYSISTNILEVPIVYGRPTGLATANNRSRYQYKPPDPVIVDDPTAKGNSSAGYILSNSGGDLYSVELVNGQIVTARQLGINPDYQIKEGTGVLLTKVNNIWYMQSPTWNPE